MHSLATALLPLLVAAVANGLAINTTDVAGVNATTGALLKGQPGPSSHPSGPPGGPPSHPSGPPGGPPGHPSGPPGGNTPKPGSAESIANMRDKIKHVVILTMENRSFANLFGGLRIPGLTNHVNSGPYCNPYSVNGDPNNKYCGQPKEVDSITNDPDHSITANNLEFYGTDNPDNDAIASGKLKPSMNGFIQSQLKFLTKAGTTNQSLAAEVMDYYSEEHIPVLASLARNYRVFNSWFSDYAGSTDPNRIFLTSGESNGHYTNDFGANVMPQVSLFQRLTEFGIEWKEYRQTMTFGDADHYKWTFENSLERIVQVQAFFDDLITGDLPPFSYVSPSCCSFNTTSMHPGGRVSDGESYIRAIYDALRNSKYWDSTLFIITFDESGGMYDPVPPPLCPAPNNVTALAKTSSGANYTVKFDRCGGRIPTLLISPWISAGVEQQGTNSDGETLPYRATSFLKTMAQFYGFENFNERVRTAPTFDHLIGTKMRADTPQFLPPVAIIDPAVSI